MTSVILAREAKERGRRRLRRTALTGAVVTLLAAMLPLIPPLGRHEPRRVLIERGMVFRPIAARLDSAGVVRSGTALRVLARVLGRDRRIQAGTYEFSAGLSLWGAMDVLTEGGRSALWVTFPEGLTSHECASILEKVLPGEGAGYLAAVRDRRLAGALGVEVDPASPGDALEGYLFPDTYALAPSTKGEEVVRLQVRDFWSVFDSSHVRQARTRTGGVHAIVTMASIVEREARINDERPRIAAVFWNRLALGMPLQADPTVRFALREWDRPLTGTDLAAASPWNTYRVKGLPPGPISNPGLASLEAALHPTPGSKELYFIAQGNGTHVFTLSGPEHVRERQRLRRMGVTEEKLMKRGREDQHG